MKQDIKDGKNVSVGDITVINEGISLAEKIEEKVEVQSEVSTSVPSVEDAVQVAAPEITPDVVVGEDENNSLDNVVPFPIPVPGVEGELVSSLPVGTTEQPSVEASNSNDNVIFPQFPLSNDQTPIDFNVPSVQSSSFDFNSSPATENNFSGFGNNFSTQNESNLNSFGFGQSVSYDNVSNFNSFQNDEELPVGIQNAMSTLKSIGQDYINLKKENEQKNLEIENLRRDNEHLKGYSKDLENQISILKNNIVNMQSRVLGMFGMGDVAGNMQNNNSYGNFNDSQSNNNGMNIAA